MPVIAIVNQKGGTGKTTLSTNLAVAFAETGRVLLLDADAQGSSHDWADSQGQARVNLDVRAADPARLLQDARRLCAEYDWVIIDGPAGISRITADAVRAADVVLIPAKPSPFDVWAASTIVDAVKARPGHVPRSSQGRFRHHHGEDAHVAGKADRGGSGGVWTGGAGVPDDRAGLLPPDGHRGSVGAGRKGQNCSR